MKCEEGVYGFLKSNGFELIKKDESNFFGDYIEVFSNGSYQLKFSSSNSFESVDIRKNQVNENWYDLALVKVLLHSGTMLNSVTTPQEYSAFLKKELFEISELFYQVNCLTTLERLEELGQERAKQLFSQIRM
jgi:hypothetical protein